MQSSQQQATTAAGMRLQPLHQPAICCRAIGVQEDQVHAAQGLAGCLDGPKGVDAALWAVQGPLPQALAAAAVSWTQGPCQQAHQRGSSLASLAALASLLHPAPQAEARGTKLLELLFTGAADRKPPPPASWRVPHAPSVLAEAPDPRSQSRRAERAEQAEQGWPSQTWLLPQWRHCNQSQ